MVKHAEKIYYPLAEPPITPDEDFCWMPLFSTKEPEYNIKVSDNYINDNFNFSEIYIARRRRQRHTTKFRLFMPLKIAKIAHSNYIGIQIPWYLDYRSGYIENTATGTTLKIPSDWPAGFSICAIEIKDIYEFFGFSADMYIPINLDICEAMCPTHNDFLIDGKCCRLWKN